MDFKLVIVFTFLMLLLTNNLTYTLFNLNKYFQNKIPLGVYYGVKNNYIM